MKTPALTWQIRRMGHSLRPSSPTGRPLRWLAAHAVRLPQAPGNRGRGAHSRHWLDPLRPPSADRQPPRAR